MRPDLLPPPAKRQKHHSEVLSSQSDEVHGRSTKNAATSSTPTIRGSPTILRCDEHFHQGKHGDMRPCESTLHRTHNVCVACYDYARRSTRLLTREQKKIEDHGAIALMCKDCAKDVINAHGITHNSCTCPFIQHKTSTAWLCFECRQTYLWQAVVAKTEWEEYKHGDPEILLDSQDRWKGVVSLDKTLCPKCKAEFSVADLGHEEAIVLACLSCKGAFVKLSTDDGAENSSRTPDDPTNASPQFTLPDWTGRIIGRLRPAPEDEDIAPDEMPEVSGRESLASLTRQHIKDNVVTAQLANINGVAQNTSHSSSHLPSSTTPSRPLQRLPTEWQFPRNPKRTPHSSEYISLPVKERYTLDELLDMRDTAWGMRHQYSNHPYCWNCREPGHTWQNCNKPDRMEMLELEIDRARWEEG